MDADGEEDEEDFPEISVDQLLDEMQGGMETLAIDEEMADDN